MDEMQLERYIKRCHTRLRELGAPLEDWRCVRVIDEEAAVFTCELCGCDKVRYVHVMAHDACEIELSVGCICAGIMEGDILAAEERERAMRNRAQRKQTFVLNGWEPMSGGVYKRLYHGSTYKIMRSRYHEQEFGVLHKGKWCWKCKGQPMQSLWSAAAAHFHTIDPPVEVYHAGKNG